MMDPAQIEDRLCEFQEMCRRRGLKVTHQRMEIFRELASSEEHLDAETVYARVRQRIPSLSLDTVYRTLHLLEDRSVIARVDSTRDRARFDSNMDRHHHFVCTGCEMIRDFYSEALDDFPIPREVSEVGRVKTVHVELRGLCRACQDKLQTSGKAKQGIRDE